MDLVAKTDQILSLKESQMIQLLPGQLAECWQRRPWRDQPLGTDVVGLVREGMMMAGLNDERVQEMNTQSQSLWFAEIWQRY